MKVSKVKAFKATVILAFLSIHFIGFTLTLEELQCGSGEYLEIDVNFGFRHCRPCPSGTFMSEIDHRNTNCQQCYTPARGSYEVVVAECTSVSDTVVGCESRYFMNTILPYDFECQRCSECEHGFIRGCGYNSDAVCCDDRECVLKCPRGYYLNNYENLCQECPSKEYMPNDDHSLTSSFPCRYTGLPIGDYSTYEVVCNGTHNLVLLTCAPGFYIADQGYQWDKECRHCFDCRHTPPNVFEIRKCDLSTNTVCCQESTMKAEKTDLGFTCKQGKDLRFSEKWPYYREVVNNEKEQSMGYGYKPITKSTTLTLVYLINANTYIIFAFVVLVLSAAIILIRIIRKNRRSFIP